MVIYTTYGYFLWCKVQVSLINLVHKKSMLFSPTKDTWAVFFFFLFLFCFPLEGKTCTFTLRFWIKVLLTFNKMTGRQCRPWSDCSNAIWTGSTLSANTVYTLWCPNIREFVNWHNGHSLLFFILVFVYFFMLLIWASRFYLSCGQVDFFLICQPLLSL